uniref:C-type lectin domain-containing protein n=1 Tax=Oncorhynchus mykiss TaxID=8022 RepID=A0A8C7TDK0_ONCMY
PSFPHYRLITICLGPLSALLLVVAIVLGVFCEYNHVQRQDSTLSIVISHSRCTCQCKLTSLHQLEIALQQQTAIKKQNIQCVFTEVSCGLCLPGWDLLNSTCYYFAISDAIESRSWGEARKDCLSYGADLVVLDSWEKQVRHGPAAIQALRYSSIVRYNTGFWIGLKEEEDTEGSWTWLDGTELTQGYWADGEPNDYKKAEDCAAIYSKTYPRKTWNDAPCTHALKWICEMKAKAAQELKL